MSTVKALKDWCSKKGNLKSYLAWRLDYDSSAAITNWIYAKKVPPRTEKQLKEILREPTQISNKRDS